MSFSSWLSEQTTKIKDAGLESLEVLGEGAVAGITDALRLGGRGSDLEAANSTAAINNAPDIGDAGDGRRHVVSAPVGTQYQAPGFIAGMPTWAKVVGGVSFVMLVGGVVVLVVRK
jgi:hypothetical protein